MWLAARLPGVMEEKCGLCACICSTLLGSPLPRKTEPKENSLQHTACSLTAVAALGARPQPAWHFRLLGKCDLQQRA